MTRRHSPDPIGPVITQIVVVTIVAQAIFVVLTAGNALFVFGVTQSST